MHIMSPTWARSPFLQFTRATMHTAPWLYWKTVCTEAGYVAISLRWFSQNQKENLDVRYPVVGMSSFSLALFATVVFFGLACSFSFLTFPFPCPHSLYPTLADHLWKQTPRKKKGRDTELSQPQLFFWNLPIMGYIWEEKVPGGGMKTRVGRGQDKFSSWKWS